VTRLVDLGVKPFLVASCLIGVVAQRLLRRVCPHCRAPWEPPEQFIAEFAPYADRLHQSTLYRGEGCDQCFGTGYRGRCGVFELMAVSMPLGGLIERRVSTTEVKEQALAEGMQTLMDGGIERVLAGDTTLEEVRQRVLVWEQTEQEAAAAG